MEVLSVSEAAFDIVENTHRNVFLTGEAGTGKTTFLKRVLNETEKNCVVVAPTGVASINAGGSTIHSMFGLPTRMFLPTMDYVDPNQAQNIPMLQGHFKYPRVKRDIFNALELLIIDEISMVRCDLFDAIDESLRFSRRNQKPFGGVQLLLIGDLFQLPPVVRQQEKELLDTYYKSEFFFDSRVYESLDILQLKLNKVYRQTNRAFIGLLNSIRNAELDQGDFETLQERYQPDFEPDEDGFVTLCSHNATTESINKSKLTALENDSIKYHADIRGDFFESQYPIEPTMELKVGAQVMFVKNDISGEKKYYNGKIAKVTELQNDKIIVEDTQKGDLIEVERVDWQNLKYSVDPSTEAVVQEEVGNFKHFPLKLAWAITIHKSQGLTLEKVIIDAGRSFAPGQVYVALSRAVSLDGLYLKSGITGRNIYLDKRIVEYSQNHASLQELPSIIENEKYIHAKNKLIQRFEMALIRDFTLSWYMKLSRKHPGKIPAEITEVYQVGIATTNKLERILLKFRQEIEDIHEKNEDIERVKETILERCNKAIRYTIETVDEEWIKMLGNHRQYFKTKPRSKRWERALDELWYSAVAKREQLLSMKYLNTPIHPEKVSLPLIQQS